MTDQNPTDWFQPEIVSAFRGPIDYQDGAAVKALVAEALAALRLPAAFVCPGDRVVLKPNWVKEHDERQPGPDHWEHVVTHPAVIEAVIDWVAPRLEGRGSIVLCDGPQTDSSFSTLVCYCGLDRLVERCSARYPGIQIQLLDLRPIEWRTLEGVTVGETRLPGDPLGNTRVALNEASEFVAFSGLGRLYGASYDMAETNAHHAGALHEYLLCRTPMEADVFINLPKLKTHKKVGVTCALKNLVGINGEKNWLPHHTEGTAGQGGDQFPNDNAKSRLEHRWMGTAKRWLKHRPKLSRWFVPVKKAGRFIFGSTRKVVRSGNWHGNDTCWRMVLDLNKALFHFEGRGSPRTKPLRYLAVVDGIIGGEGDGPMSPDPVSCGVVLAGTHPASVDAVAATLMGFDWRKLRLIQGSFRIQKMNFVSFSPDAIKVLSNHPSWAGPLSDLDDTFQFRPHFGWIGAIENQRQSHPA